MQKAEAQQLLLKIIEYAEKGKSTEFHLITSWQNFRICRQNRRTTELIIRALNVAADNLFRDYCRDVSAGTTNVNKLLAFSQLQNITAFYKKDLDTLKCMLDEYDDYLGKGHFWYSFLGGERDIWN